VRQGAAGAGHGERGRAHPAEPVIGRGHPLAAGKPRASVRLVLWPLPS
jgi:hypothetical protein